MLIDWMVDLLIDVLIGLIWKCSRTGIPIGLLHRTVCKSDSSLRKSSTSYVPDSGWETKVTCEIFIHFFL